MINQPFWVLIVEDNPGDARLIQHMLLEASADKVLPSEIDWIHKTCLNEAIDCLEKTQVNIILLDLSLPDSQGAHTFQKMQQAFPMIPIIVLSGVDREETAVSALQHGIQEYLVKGRFDTYLLGRAIRYAIERQRLRADLEKKNQALLDSELRRQALMENNPDGIVIVNEDNIIRFSNDAAAQILGQLKEVLFGQTLNIHYQLHQINTQTIVREDGKTAVVELRPIPSEWHGEAVYILYLREITQQKLAEDKIRESDERLRSILASMDDLVFVLDKEGRFLSYSYPSESSGIRVAPSFILGKPYQDILPKHIVPIINSVIKKVRNLDWVQHVEYPLFNQGKEYWFSAKISSRKTADGQIAGLTMVIRDITELKQAEKELLHKTDQLETLRQISLELTTKLDWEPMLNAIVDQAIELFDGEVGRLYLYESETKSLTHTLTNQMEQVANNKSIERSHRLAYQILDTKKLTITYPYTPKNTETNVKHAIIGVPIRWRKEFLGVLIVVANLDRPFSNSEVELLTLFASQTAVTIQNARFHKQIQHYNSELEAMVIERTDMLMDAYVQLQMLDEIKTKFIHDISHELRTPTANIQLYLSLIKRGVPEKLPHYLSVLDKEAGRLEQLIEGILNYSNLLIDKDDLEFCAVNFSQIVSDIVASLDSDIEKHQLTLHKNIDQSVPPINGSAEQLKLLVSHLVVNAIKYSKQGTITISVKSHDADKAVCLEVVDDGIGISPNEQNHIFERFYRGQKIGQSNIPGIGMGLAIVKEIVDIHNGRINVTSKKDVGSTFRIWLPTVNTTEEVHYAR